MIDYSEDAFYGYLAAFIDADGSIFTRRIRYNHYVRIVLVNTHLPTLEAIQNRLGFGVIRKYEKSLNQLGTKQIYHLYFDGLERNEFILDRIYPYLSVKKEHGARAKIIINNWRISLLRTQKRNLEIMEAIKSGEPQHKIAKRYGVSQQLISRIKLGHLWPSIHKRKRKSPNQIPCVFELVSLTEKVTCATET